MGVAPPPAWGLAPVAAVAAAAIAAAAGVTGGLDMLVGPLCARRYIFLPPPTQSRVPPPFGLTRARPGPVCVPPSFTAPPDASNRNHGAALDRSSNPCVVDWRAGEGGEQSSDQASPKTKDTYTPCIRAVRGV